MTRHQRRKAAKAASLAKSERIAVAAKAYDRAQTVKRNMGSPIERNYYPQSQLASFGDTAARFSSSGRGPGSMNRRRALALKAQGKW
jgi:hypothetical protein